MKEMFARIMAAIRTVLRRVMRAGKAVGRGAARGAQAAFEVVEDVVDWTVDTAASIPGMLRDAVLGRGGPSQDEQLAAQQAAAQAAQEQAAAEAAAKLREKVQAVRRVASALGQRKPVPEDAKAMVPVDVLGYLQTLDEAELGRIVVMRSEQIQALLESAPAPRAPMKEAAPSAAPAPAPAVVARIDAYRARRTGAAPTNDDRDRAEDLVAAYAPR